MSLDTIPFQVSNNTNHMLPKDIARSKIPDLIHNVACAELNWLTQTESGKKVAVEDYHPFIRTLYSPLTPTFERCETDYFHGAQSTYYIPDESNPLRRVAVNTRIYTWDELRYPQAAIRRHYHLPKRNLYIDMDGVLCDFMKAFHLEGKDKYQKGFFLELEPIHGAIRTVLDLIPHFDTYILSAPMWDNPQSCKEKIQWVKTYFGDRFKDRVMLVNHKWHVGQAGSFLIDDNKLLGNERFRGLHIHFGETNFENWAKVKDYLMQHILSLV